MSIECVYSNVVDLAIPCKSKAIEKKRKIKDEDKKREGKYKGSRREKKRQSQN